MLKTRAYIDTTSQKPINILDTRYNMSTFQPCPEELSSRLFSVVIIGGGTAGLVLAARLSEDPDISVLVLEAGENRLNVSLPVDIARFKCKPH